MVMASCSLALALPASRTDDDIYRLIGRSILATDHDDRLTLQAWEEQNGGKTNPNSLLEDIKHLFKTQETLKVMVIPDADSAGLTAALRAHDRPYVRLSNPAQNSG
jgi:hypothetical protein